MKPQSLDAELLVAWNPAWIRARLCDDGDLCRELRFDFTNCTLIGITALVNSERSPMTGICEITFRKLMFLLNI